MLKPFIVFTLGAAIASFSLPLALQNVAEQYAVTAIILGAFIMVYSLFMAVRP